MEAKKHKRSLHTHVLIEMMYVICSSVPIVEWIVINSVLVSLVNVQIRRPRP
jgi:hypothetical protein